MSLRNLLRILVVGFALLVMLVLAAAYLGYRGSRSIQSNAQQMVRDHVLKEGKGTELESQIEQQSEELLTNLERILGICFMLAIGCAVGTTTLISRTAHQVEWQAEELNRVSWNLIEDQERTARRFSHEMHDELGQSLTGLKSMAKKLSGPEFENSRDEFVGILTQALAGVRELSQLLRPVILDDFGLSAGLRWLTERFSQRARIEVEYTSNLEGRLSDVLETHLFRITQEALTNVARHSGASKVWVSLNAKGDQLELVIRDNGRGLQATSKQMPSLGMVGMRARARHLNGTLKVENHRSGGLLVEALVPLTRSNNNGDQEDESSAG